VDFFGPFLKVFRAGGYGVGGNGLGVFCQLRGCQITADKPRMAPAYFWKGFPQCLQRGDNPSDSQSMDRLDPGDELYLLFLRKSDNGVIGSQDDMRSGRTQCHGFLKQDDRERDDGSDAGTQVICPTFQVLDDTFGKAEENRYRSRFGMVRF